MLKAAVLLDGGFVKKLLKRSLGRNPAADDVTGVVDRIMGRVPLRGRALLRAFYYDAMPLQKKSRHPVSGQVVNFATTDTARANETLIRDIETREPYAVRMGVPTSARTTLFGSLRNSMDGWANKSATDLSWTSCCLSHPTCSPMGSM